MKHRPCEKHDDCTRPDGHAGECVSGLELLKGWTTGELEQLERVRGVGDAFSGRVCPSCGWHESGRREGDALCYVCRAPMSPRSEAQDDGRACVICGAESVAMVPTGSRGSRGAQLFRCERHAGPA